MVSPALFVTDAEGSVWACAACVNPRTIAIQPALQLPLQRATNPLHMRYDPVAVVRQDRDAVNSADRDRRRTPQASPAHGRSGPGHSARRSTRSFRRLGQSLSHGTSDTLRSVSWLAGRRPACPFPGLPPVGAKPKSRMHNVLAAYSYKDSARIGDGPRTDFPVPMRRQHLTAAIREGEGTSAGRAAHPLRRDGMSAFFTLRRRSATCTQAIQHLRSLA